MSTHPIPSPAGDLEDSIRWQRAAALQRLAPVYLGREATLVDDGTTLSLVFDPDLTPEETTTLQRLIASSGREVAITPDEWATIEDDIAGLRIYYGLASPTNAQTIAAVKALITIVRATVRD